MNTLHLKPVDYQDAISDDPARRADAQQKMGQMLSQYGFGFWTNVRIPNYRITLLYSAGLECMERWEEVVARSSREHLGMIGPTGINEETHPNSEPECKMYIAVDANGKGFPSDIPGGGSATLLFDHLYMIGFVTVRMLELHRGHPDGYLSGELTRGIPPKSHTSARLNLYPKNIGFSTPHEDTGIVAALLWKPGLMIKQGDEYVELVGAKDGDVVVNIGASGSKYFTGLFGMSTWHCVRKMNEDRVSFVVFVHTNKHTCFPGTVENVYKWCSDRFTRRGGTVDRQAASFSKA